MTSFAPSFLCTPNNFQLRHLAADTNIRPLVVGAALWIWLCGVWKRIFIPGLLVLACRAETERGELLIFHPAQKSWVSLVSGARFWFQFCVSTSLWEVTDQVLIWGPEANSITLPSLAESLLSARHWAQGFVNITSFNFSYFGSPVSQELLLPFFRERNRGLEKEIQMS